MGLIFVLSVLDIHVYVEIGREMNTMREEKKEFWTFCVSQDKEAISVLVLFAISKNGYETFV